MKRRAAVVRAYSRCRERRGGGWAGGGRSEAGGGSGFQASTDEGVLVDGGVVVAGYGGDVVRARLQFCFVLV